MPNHPSHSSLDAPLQLLTVGHSNHTPNAFFTLLATAKITAIADVRSAPYSRYCPWFNRDGLQQALAARGITYHFMGDELGARSPDPDCYDAGKVVYARLANTGPFRRGIDRLIELAASSTLAVMCAEKEPLDCHRTLLIARVLGARSIAVSHLLADGQLEPHTATEKRLLDLTGLEPPPLFGGPAALRESLDRAYELRGHQIAYARTEEPADSLPAMFA